MNRPIYKRAEFSFVQHVSDAALSFGVDLSICEIVVHVS